MRTLSVVLIAFLVMPPLQAAADEDLRQRFEEGARARFSGEELVVSWWGAREVAGVFQVSQSDGVALVSHDSREALVAEGAVLERRDSGWRRIGIAAPAGWSLSERYRVASKPLDTHMGRSVEPIEIWEGDLLRSKLVFDRQTSVPLLTKVFDGGGEAFRMSNFTTFQASAPALVPLPAAIERTMRETDPGSLPVEVHGYRLTGAYAGPHEGIHGYYTDGLFAFSVFQVEGYREAALADEVAFDVDGGRYRVRVMPAELWVLWTGEDHTYLLIGDLPPDHLAEVLTELPEPDHPSLIERLRRFLFRGR